MKLSEAIRGLKRSTHTAGHLIDGCVLNEALEKAAELAEAREQMLGQDIDYSVETPETTKFMNLIDDSEIDLAMVEDHIHDLECKIKHYKRILEV
jgi:predicted RNase H-like nuclease (RuvC/YqgF family)